MPCTAAEHVAEKSFAVQLGVRRAGGRGPVAPGVFLGDRGGGGGHMRERTILPKGHLRARVAPPPPHSSPPAPAPMTSLTGGTLLPGTCGWVWRGGAPSRGETAKNIIPTTTSVLLTPLPSRVCLPSRGPSKPTAHHGAAGQGEDRQDGSRLHGDEERGVGREGGAVEEGGEERRGRKKKRGVKKRERKKRPPPPTHTTYVNVP